MALFPLVHTVLWKSSCFHFFFLILKLFRSNIPSKNTLIIKFEHHFKVNIKYLGYTCFFM